jgi:hypothetical protein
LGKDGKMRWEGGRTHEGGEGGEVGFWYCGHFVDLVVGDVVVDVVVCIVEFGGGLLVVELYIYMYMCEDDAVGEMRLMRCD